VITVDRSLGSGGEPQTGQNLERRPWFRGNS
jgi:hypothetical protein